MVSGSGIEGSVMLYRTDLYYYMVLGSFIESLLMLYRIGLCYWIVLLYGIGFCYRELDSVI